ncbi:Protein of unknown function [Jannaschia seohaensis]|uniref:Uncharacterized protein DUF3987 n=1 Tax=Jannaschia seohaensis TaxID=475081 RepID=A0A2Y9AUX0_9RHOB|nr:uncharacterized protein DUF3987 [Jannaschia seohaensis]SSA46019.1 Protein of unknown function [Jannaschia seohaensis]
MLIPIAPSVPAPDPMDGEPEPSDAMAVQAADPNAWPAPDMRLLSPDLPPAPPLPLKDVLSPRAAAWVAATAEGAGAPADYVLAALLAVASAAMGNARWVTIWPGWSEPPTLWTMAIGNPSAGKSPAIASVLAPLEAAERPLRREAEDARDAWAKSAKLAEVKAEAWKAAVKAALKKGTEPPELPEDARTGEPPHLPRLVIRDATVEKVGTILHAHAGQNVDGHVAHAEHDNPAQHDGGRPELCAGPAGTLGAGGAARAGR